MNTGTDILRSRFARRLICTFILAAILPVIALAIVSLTTVTTQLLSRQGEHLHQEVKSIGLSTFDKLSFVGAELLTLANHLSDKTSQKDLFPPYIEKNISQKFKNIVWMTSTIELGLFGTIEEKILTNARESNNLGKERIFTYKNNNGQSRIFMAISVQTVERGIGTLIGEIKNDYIWSTLQTQAQHYLCITNQKGIPLYCNQPEETQQLDRLRENLKKSISGSFEWRLANVEHISTYWSIFLESRFWADDWVVVISTPQETASESAENFKSSFAIVIVTALLLVVVISIRQIRKVIEPLKTLTDATKNIGNIEFNREVVIDSNDEFSDLSDAFNSMSKKLSQQFNSIETMAEIDRLILSSLDSTDIVETVLARTQDVIACDCIGISISNSKGLFTQMHIQVHEQGSRVVDIELSKKDRLTLERNKQGIAVNLNIHSLSFLSALKDTAVNCCLVTPLFLDEHLSAIIVFAYQHYLPQQNQILSDARSWADRISVALSNAKWQEKLYYQAHYDVLTGLPNRFALKDYLDQALNRARRENAKLAVLFIDLDRFKLINDSMGHTVGDRYLQMISKRINESIRSTDMVARLGGDEFTVVVMDDASNHSLNTSVSMVSGKILSSINAPLRIEGQELRATASIGVAVYPEDADSAEDLLKNADSAMYNAKSNSGGNYSYYSEEFNTKIRQQMEVEHEVRLALQRDEFEVYFQPQVSLASGDVVGAEALIRWNHPTKGLVSPGLFVPIAEETNLILELDLWMVKAVCTQLQSWSDSGYHPIHVAINISGKLFQDQHVADQLTQIAHQFGESAKQLAFEITEGSLIEDIDYTLTILNKFDQLGIELAIDDFGTGYSSLSYLKQLPVHKLKIDQSFVRNCDTCDVDSALVKTIINLSHDLKLKCIAEGVETSSQLDVIQQYGCDEFQGYFCSRPVSAGVFARQFLANSNVPQQMPQNANYTH